MLHLWIHGDIGRFGQPGADGAAFYLEKKGDGFILQRPFFFLFLFSSRQ
jgi:hypothetical protein